MRLNKIAIVIVLIVLMLFSLSYTSYGYSFKIDAVPNKKIVGLGDSISLTLALKNFDAESTDGTSAVHTIIEYDKDVFETIKQENIENLNGWTASYNKGNSEHILFERNDHIKTDSNLCTITFKIKENAKPGKTQIIFKNTELSINKTATIVGTEDVTVDIYVMGYVVKNNTLKVLPNTTVDTLKNNINLPGYSINIYNASGTEVTSSSIVATGFSIEIKNGEDTIAHHKIAVKGDLNSDGKISLVDIARAELGYIGNIELKDEYLQAVDINNDGKYTLSDIARLEQYLVGLIQI